MNTQKASKELLLVNTGYSKKNSYYPNLKDSVTK